MDIHISPIINSKANDVESMRSHDLAQQLISWGMVKETQLVKLHRAISDGSEFPARLVQEGIINNRDLQTALMAQSYLSDKLMSDSAISAAIYFVRRRSIPFATALEILGVKPANQPRNRLGDLLLESGRIDAVKLDSRLIEARRTCSFLGAVLKRRMRSSPSFSDCVFQLSTQSGAGIYREKQHCKIWEHERVLPLTGPHDFWPVGNAPKPSPKAKARELNRNLG